MILSLFSARVSLEEGKQQSFQKSYSFIFTSMLPEDYRGDIPVLVLYAG